MSRHYDVDPSVDTRANRIKLFETCIHNIEQSMVGKENVTIALPRLIGCGYVGGEWETYRKIIANMAARNPGWTVRVVEGTTRGAETGCAKAGQAFGMDDSSTNAILKGYGDGLNPETSRDALTNPRLDTRAKRSRISRQELECSILTMP